MSYRRAALLALSATAMIAVLAACATTQREEQPAEAAETLLVDTNLHETEGTDPEFDDVDPADAIDFNPPELDPVEREADLPGESRIWPLADTFVGEVTDELFIAVTFDENYTTGDYDVLVYLCDSEETMVYLAGQFDSDGTTLAGEIVEVEFAMDYGEITGTVSIDDELHEFSATGASEPAGLYIAEYTSDGQPSVALWIVNEAGEQRGSILDLPCIPVPRVGCISLPRTN